MVTSKDIGTFVYYQGKLVKLLHLDKELGLISDPTMPNPSNIPGLDQVYVPLRFLQSNQS